MEPGQHLQRENQKTTTPKMIHIDKQYEDQINQKTYVQLQSTCNTSEYVLLISGIKKQNTLNKIFEGLPQAQWKQLGLKFVFLLNIFQAISIPRYPNLIELDLSQSSIRNIQPIAFIDVPNLQLLKIFVNKIVSIKPLNKSNWPKLKHLNLMGNPIIETTFNRIKMHSNFEEIIFEKIILEKCLNEDLSLFVKLQSQTFAFLSLKRKGRIPQPRLANIVKQKFKNNKN